MRCTSWQQKRQEKIYQAKQYQDSKEYYQCTFTPMIQPQVPDLVPEGVSEFNRKGIIEYFERIEQAKQIKCQKERQQQSRAGEKWQNRITVPKEFNFMKRNGSRDISPNVTNRPFPNDYNSSMF